MFLPVDWYVVIDLSRDHNAFVFKDWGLNRRVSGTSNSATQINNPVVIFRGLQSGSFNSVMNGKHLKGKQCTSETMETAVQKSERYT